MTYKAALGENIAEVSLVDLDPQPKMRGLKNGRRRVAGNGLTYQDGAGNASLEYGYLTSSDWAGLLTLFGLTGGTVSNAITITLPDNYNRTFSRYNAVVVLPDLPEEAEYTGRKFVSVEFALMGIEKIDS